MTNTTDHALTVREMQQLAVSALDELLSLDLPELSWNLFRNPYRSTPELNGQVYHGLDDAHRRDDLEMWAKVIKAEITEQETEWGTILRANGTYDGVTVSIFGYVNEPDD